MSLVHVRVRSSSPGGAVVGVERKRDVLRLRDVVHHDDELHRAVRVDDINFTPTDLNNCQGFVFPIRFSHLINGIKLSEIVFSNLAGFVL